MPEPTTRHHLGVHDCPTGTRPCGVEFVSGRDVDVSEGFADHIQLDSFDSEMFSPIWTRTLYFVEHDGKYITTIATTQE